MDLFFTLREIFFPVTRTKNQSGLSRHEIFSLSDQKPHEGLFGGKRLQGYIYFPFLLSPDLGHYCKTMKGDLLLNMSITGNKH